MSGGGDNSRGSWDPLAGVEASRRIVPTPQYKDPLAADVADFLNSCQRVAKALRVYDRNNSIIHQFMDRAMAQLTSVHERQPELLLTVREDRLRFERDPVLINADRHEGIPFILYRNAFRRLTFERGMTRAELLEFLAALTVDFNAFDQTGEDLLTILWRLKLPHLRYFTIDALTTTAAVGGTPNHEESEEIERIQGDIDGLVARIYGQTQVDDADLVKGASITREDLEALKEIRQGNEEDLDMLDVSTARAIAEIPKREIAQIKATLDADDRDTLTSRLVDILLHLLFRDRSSVNTPKLIELMQQIFDSVLLAGKVGQATHVIRRLRAVEATDDLQAVHVSKHLMRLLLTETRTVQIVSALNEGKHASAPQEVLELLRAFGPSMGPVLLGVIDAVTSAGNRRLVCELIVELGVPEPSVLLDRLQRSSQLVVLDLLAIAQRLSRDELAPILLWAVEHETPKVRAFALLLLRPYPAGVADELVVKALRDADPNVRSSAYRLIGLRKHASYRAAIEALLREDELWSRDARELMTLLLAYATVAGDEGVPALDKILSPGFFARSRMTSGQIAAAAALGRLGSPAARDALTRGMRTLNSKVREACRRALAREADPEPEPELTPAHGMVLAEFTRERASDLELSAELGRNDDPLERARHVKPREIQAVPQRAAPRPTAAAPDGVGVVRRATPTVDTIPERLSRAALKIEDPSERAARAASSTSHEVAAPTGGARELDLSDIEALVSDVARLDEPSRLGTGPRQSSLPPPVATPARGFSAPPPAATPARGFSAPPPAATPAHGFSPPSSDDEEPPPMPTQGLAPPPASLAARAGRGLPFAPTPPSSSSSGIMSPVAGYSAPPPGRALPTASGLVAPPPLSATVGGSGVVLPPSGFVHPTEGEEAAWEPGDAAPPPSPASPVPVWSAPQPTSVGPRPAPSPVAATSAAWTPPAPPGAAASASAVPTWAQPLPVPSAIGPAPTPPASSAGLAPPLGAAPAPLSAAPAQAPWGHGATPLDIGPAAPAMAGFAPAPAPSFSQASPGFGAPPAPSFSQASPGFGAPPAPSFSQGSPGFGAPLAPSLAQGSPGFGASFAPSFAQGSPGFGAAPAPPLASAAPGLVGVPAELAVPTFALSASAGHVGPLAAPLPHESGFAAALTSSFGPGSALPAPPVAPPLPSTPLASPVLPIGAPSLAPTGWSAPLPAPPVAAPGILHASAGHPPYATPLPPGPAVPGVGAPPPPVSAWVSPASATAPVPRPVVSDLDAGPVVGAEPSPVWTGGALPPLPGLEGLPSWGSARAEPAPSAMLTWAHDMERATLASDRARAEAPAATPLTLGELPPLGVVLGARTPAGPGAPPPTATVLPTPVVVRPLAMGSAVAVPHPALAPPPPPSGTPRASPLAPGVSAAGRPSFAEGLEDAFVASPHVPPPTAPAPPPPRLPASLPPTWVARSPERSRDLAPLALNPDSGTHPTWDDDSSKEEG